MSLSAGSRAISLSAGSRAVAAMLIGTGAFVLNDSCLKVLAPAMPTSEILFLRGLFATVGLFGLAWFTGQLGRIRAGFTPLVLGRGVLEMGSAFLFISVITVVPLGNLTAIAQIVPLIVTLLGALVLGEIVGARRWAAVAIGFLGAVLVAGPGQGSFDVYTLFAFGVPVMVSVRDLIVRHLGTKIGVLPMTFWLSAVVTVGAGLLGLVGGGWRMPDASHWLLIAAAAGLALLGHASFVYALQISAMSRVAPFYYAQTVWAVLAGLMIFGEVPRIGVIAGIVLIVGAGLYTLHRERVRHQPITPPPVVA
jgi:drug/metabolite transporter (DMT)-like permease